MSVTLKQARVAVRELLDEETPATFKDSHLDRWINEGCIEIARSAEVLETSDTIDVVASTREYDLPDDMIRAHRVDFEVDGDGRHASLGYRDFHNANAVQWHGDYEGMPTLYTMWGRPGAVKLVLYPSPAYTGTLTVHYYKLPTPPTDDTSTLDIPEGWENVVYLYAEYRALRRDRDPRWQESKALFDEALGALYDISRRHTDQAGEITPDFGSTNSWLYEMDGGY